MPHIISECSSNKLNALNINWRKALQRQMIARQLLLLEPHLQYDKTVFSAKVGKPKLEQTLQIKLFSSFNQTTNFPRNIMFYKEAKKLKICENLQKVAEKCRFAESWRMTVLDSWLRTEATITLLWRKGARRFAASVSGARRNWRSYDEDSETIWSFLCDIVMCLTYDMQIICISTIYIYCLYYHIIIFHIPCPICWHFTFNVALSSSFY